MKYDSYINKFSCIFYHSKAQNAFVIILFTFLIVIRAWGGIDVVRGDDARMLTSALLKPQTSVLAPYAGYLQVAPRAIICAISHLPLLYFPFFVFIVTTTIWVCNILLFTRACSIFASSRALGVILGLSITVMPPTGIEILAYLDHIQVPMLLGILSTILSRKYFNSITANILFLFYVIIFGLSSPSSIVLIATFAIIRFIHYKDTTRFAWLEKIIFIISVICFIIQLLVTLNQNDRTASFSLKNLIDGFRFGIYSIAPQPIRDHFFAGFKKVDAIWFAIVCSILVYNIFSILVYFLRNYNIKPYMGSFIIGLGIFVFFISISNNPHNGYLVIPTALIFLGTAMSIAKTNNLYRTKLAFFALGYVFFSSIQSFIPDKKSDVFFGGQGYIYANLIPWSSALADAKLSLAGNQKNETILVNTDVNEPYWPVIVPRNRLE